MMTVIRGSERHYAEKHKDYSKIKFESLEHRDIFENFIGNSYAPTHKRVKDEELFYSPKMFLYDDGSVSIVTGDQTHGGRAYIDHCKKYLGSIDRNHNIIFLHERRGKFAVVDEATLPDGTCLSIMDYHAVYDFYPYASTIHAYAISKVSMPGSFAPKGNETYLFVLMFENSAETRGAYEMLVNGKRKLSDYADKLHDKRYKDCL